MKNDSPLHCILSEESSFNQKYVTNKDYDAIHKDNPLYSSLKKKLVESIKEFYEESKKEHQKITTYTQLLPKGTTKASKTEMHRLFLKIIEELLIEVGASSLGHQQAIQIEAIVSAFKQELCLAIFDIKAFSGSFPPQHVTFFNSLIGTLCGIFVAKNDEYKLKSVPTEWYYAEVSESAKAISSYNYFRGNRVTTEYLNGKSYPQEIIETLIREYAPVILKLNDSYGPNLTFHCNEIITVDGKETSYNYREVFADIKRVYKDKEDIFNLSMNFIGENDFMSTIEFDCNRKGYRKIHLPRSIIFLQKRFQSNTSFYLMLQKELTKFALFVVEKDVKS